MMKDQCCKLWLTGKGESNGWQVEQIVLPLRLICKSSDQYLKRLMDFNYVNYVQRYHYQKSTWPPDIGLAELHARCSEPGMINTKSGVKCPCCDRFSKHKYNKWWKRDINDDFKDHGSALPGYFQLLKYYAFFCICVFLVNSIYPIYATYYACEGFEEGQSECLKVGYFYYLDYKTLISILNKHHKVDMVNMLQVLQTAVFYILLAANCFSIFFITFLNESAKLEIKQAKKNGNIFQNCLCFFNVPPEIANNFRHLVKIEGEDSLNVVRTMNLYEVKKYYELYHERNLVYYRLLSIVVQGDDPFKANKLNMKLEKLQEQTMLEKLKIGRYNGKIMVLFDDANSKKLMHRIYRIGFHKKWYYGLRTILRQFKIMDFDTSKMEVSSSEVQGISGVKWENLGEPMGLKMATRIKTFVVAVVLILICYFILVYPILFVMRTHIKSETKRFTKLNTFEKILPDILALVQVSIAISFRIYMTKLSDERNPKDEVEKSKFVLLSVVAFHILFYILIPTFFFMYPNNLNPTVKLYVIAQQARTFIIIQLIIIIVDMPYRIWKNKKVQALSDQRHAFRHNQGMLHKLVQSRDYPLEIRLQVLLRVWSLALFYSFFLPYMIFYIIAGFLIIYWVEKRNLYRHYTPHKKISIRLLTEVLTFFVNFFCVYLCFIYCFNVTSNIKIIVACAITFGGLVANIVYWIVLNRAKDATTIEAILKTDLTESIGLDQSVLLKKSYSEQRADGFEEAYWNFLKEYQDEKLDKDIDNYLRMFRRKERAEQKLRMSMPINMELVGYNESSQSESEPQTDKPSYY